MKLKLLIFFILIFVVYPNNKTIDGVAAIVEENIILKSDLMQMVNITATQNKINISETSEAYIKLKNNVLQSMIDQKVMLEMAILDSISVEETEVNNSLDQQIENLILQSGGEENAEKIIGQKIKDFRREFWYEMQDRLISEKYQQSLLSNITVTNEDVKSFILTYKDSLPKIPTKVKIRHLLKKTKPNIESIKKTKTKLLEIKLKIETKQNTFSELAKTYSQDPGSKNNGGNLGWVKRGSLVKEFESSAFTLNINKISNPIETEFGLHIIETLEKKGDKIKVRHILLIPEITEKDIKNTFMFTKSLKEDSIKTLIDFKNMVKNHSDDKLTNKIGGSLGWIDPLNYSVLEIGQAVKYLEKNKCSPPINSSIGIHLLWVENIKEGGVLNLKNHYIEIENLALNHKKINWYDLWIKKARKQFYINKNIN